MRAGLPLTLPHVLHTLWASLSLKTNDVPQSLVDQTQLNERWFTLKLGVSAVFDYTAFATDADD